MKFFQSILEVVDALDDVLERVQLLLLVKFEHDHIFVEIFHVLFPRLELFPLDARRVTRGSQIC